LAGLEASTARFAEEADQGVAAVRALPPKPSTQDGLAGSRTKGQMVWLVNLSNKMGRFDFSQKGIARIDYS